MPAEFRRYTFLEMGKTKIQFVGGCSCKSIRYECFSDPLAMVNCHCRDCQYASGAGHSSFIVAPTEKITITGSPKYYESKSATGNIVSRGFCPNCGTPMFAMNSARKKYISIKVATMDDPSCFKPSIDVWISSSHSWDLLSPETKKFDKEIVH